MVIGVIFQFASETIEIQVDNTNVLFRTQGTNGAWASIDNIKLDYVGVCREHPDLELRDDWKDETIKRFKDKIKQMKTEDERVGYIIKDLEKFGYKALYKQKSGFRVEKL